MRTPKDLAAGDLVVSRNRKWNGKDHWVVPGTYLGADEHGWWIFQGAHEFCSRPGAAFYAESDAVLLVPRSGEYVATFYDEAHPAGVQVYVDLDVIRTVDRGVYVDDEDEFAEHRIDMDYPADVVDRITAASDQLYQAVKAQQPPFDGADREWFRRGRA
ncbi:hypothetical protein ACOM2C_00740 [Pseudarthrobacter sp. So.54]